MDANKTIRRISPNERQCEKWLSVLGYGPVLDDKDIRAVLAHIASMVSRFQKDHNLPVTGNCDSKTIAAIKKALDEKSKKPKTVFYTATITKLTKAQANELKKKYPNCSIKKS